ncbi:DUF5691 domain-containing protein [Ideonella azotifigens]|uniref:HEAT repeat domain-containing protein n=2 Tax=Ideonella azotifigens TaxID=513160 RepID=A0ABN1JQB5_9BURK|nr:DUF5691 domain-containing protein [Ideonella azotifigens]MCD2340165.1 DUF5691 domain-containing protein [Ideonella azotifigens]
MSVWTPLLPQAMVGTDRQAQALPTWPGEVGALVAASATSGQPATDLLRAATVLAVCSLAGAQGATWTQPLPASAPEDHLPTLPPGPVQSALVWTLQEGPASLQQQAFAALAHAGLRLPTGLLPQALALGRRSLALRPLLLPVLGERGLWLAAQNEEWRHVGGVSAEAADEARWQEGSFEQRRAFLRQERAADPAAARERLQAALTELPAQERADLLTVLADGLGADDEPLLDSLRADRSREVRQAALALLLRLPNAAHPTRAAARMAALLKQERALLRKRWTVDAPTELPADAKADNLDTPRPKNDTLGERAWWLYQLVRQVPLAWWTTHTDMDAAELLAWGLGTDWAEALLRGWRDVLFAAPEAAWCEALLDRWPAVSLRDDPASVLALLPLAARERHWLRRLQANELGGLLTVVQQVLAANPPGQSLSPTLSAALVTALLPRLQGQALRDDYALRALLPELCCALHQDALPALAQVPRQADETPSIAQALQTMMQVIAARQAFHSLTRT